jgi:hypothetical protein
LGREIETNIQTYRKTERVRQKERDNKNIWQVRVAHLVQYGTMFSMNSTRQYGLKLAPDDKGAQLRH